MKKLRILLLTSLTTLTGCGTTPQNLTLAPGTATSAPLIITTGKDVKTTLRNAALPVLVWYMQQRLAVPASGK